MYSKFVFVGVISDIKKHDGGINNQGFYTATVLTKTTNEEGKEKETYHKVMYFSDYVCKRVAALKNKDYVATDGRVGSRKNESTGHWESVFYGSMIEPFFNKPKVAEAEKVKDDDDGIPY